MKHLPFLLFLFLFSCSQHKAPEQTKSADIPAYKPEKRVSLPDPVVTDTVYRTRRVEVPVMWSWQDNPTPQSEIVQPDANLEVGYVPQNFDNGSIALSGIFGPYKFDLKGTITLPTDVTVTPNEPEDTTGGPDDPPVETDYVIGSNSFPWVPLDKIDAFQSLRIYIASGWIWRPGGLFVQPMYQAETEVAHGLDDMFTAAKAKGIDILPCINQTPDWFAGVPQGIGSNDYPPIKNGLNREDPESWKPWADFWFQFVARYGSKVHPESELKIDKTPRWNNDITNVAKSGLNLIKQVEIGNEYDRWWDIGTPKYVNGREHAAMLVAVIKAIKQADPNMGIVMAGLTGFDLAYLKEMDAVFRQYEIDWPIVNVHHYSHEGNVYGKWPPTWKNSGATYPENDKDFPMIAEIVAFAKERGVPVWVTEFGADTEPPSWMHIDGKKWGITDEQAQAELIVRTFKEYKKYGVKRAYVFTGVDENGGTGLWQRSGVLKNKQNGYAPKPAYEAVKRLREQIFSNN